MARATIIKRPFGKVTHPWWATIRQCYERHGVAMDWGPHLQHLFAEGLRRYEDAAAPPLQLGDFEGVISKRSITLTVDLDAHQAERIRYYRGALNYSDADLIALFIRIGYEEVC